MTEILAPLLLLSLVAFALWKKVDVFGSFLSGAKDGLQSAVSVLQALCFLMTALGMVKASGALDALTQWLAPLWERVGFPPEVAPLALLRPFSGSGALAYYKELGETLPPDSFGERVAAVLMGGSETTFYTLAVYYGAVGIKKIRNTLWAALLADFAAAVLSVLAVRLFFG